MVNLDINRSSNYLVSIMIITVLLAILVLIVTIVVGAMGDAYASHQGNEYETHEITNETPSWINSTGYDLEYASTCDENYDITEVYDVSNDSDHVLIPEDEYMVTDEGIVYNATTTEYDDTSISYTCDEDVTDETSVSEGYDATESGVLDMVKNFFSLVPVIGTVLAVVILIGTIVILVAYVARMRGTSTAEQSFAG